MVEGETKIIKESSKHYKNLDNLEQKLNDYRRIQDRNDYDCVNACSSFLAKAINHIKTTAGIPVEEIYSFIEMNNEFNLEQLLDHFTKYSYKK